MNITIMQPFFIIRIRKGIFFTTNIVITMCISSVYPISACSIPFSSILHLSVNPYSASPPSPSPCSNLSFFYTCIIGPFYLTSMNITYRYINSMRCFWPLRFRYDRFRFMSRYDRYFFMFRLRLKCFRSEKVLV